MQDQRTLSQQQEIRFSQISIAIAAGINLMSVFELNFLNMYVINNQLLSFQKRRKNTNQIMNTIGDSVIQTQSKLDHLVFILCHTVKWISNVWEYYMVLMYGKVGNLSTLELISISVFQVTAWPNWVSYSISLSHLLITLNCSVNFFIYFIKHRQRKNSCNISQGSTVMEMDTMVLSSNYYIFIFYELTICRSLDHLQHHKHFYHSQTQKI